MSNKEAFIIDGIRTPIGKLKGSLSSIRADDLAAIPIKELLKRNPELDPASVEDVILGCANQAGEDNRNVARMAALLAGLPVSVPGETVNRLCASGMSATIRAFHAIKAGEGDVFITGGVEHMTRGPIVLGKGSSPYSGTTEMHDSTFGWRFVNPKMHEMHGTDGMGMTAENVVEMHKISREDQDKFAVNSQTKAANARDNGLFTEIVPTPAYRYVKQSNGTYKREQFTVEHDDGIRESTPEGLGKLRTVFSATGSVTAGNSSQTTDGAAATIIASKEKCDALGLKPVAKLLSYATIGCKSDEMGVGPRYAIPKVLQQTGMTIDDIDIYEINEAFASQALYSIRALDLEKYMERINIHGGAIALGHPLGCTGAKLTATCLANLEEVKGKYGIVSMCIGGGMGAAAIFERL